MNEPPFAPRSHDLGDGITLAPIPPEAVDALAARVVALDPWARAGVPAAALVERMTRPWAATHRFVVEREGAAVGYVSVRWPFMRGPYLENIAIFPEAQRRGLARRVIAWMGREVSGAEANLWLCVTEWNEPARATYRALGFVEVGPLADLTALGQNEIFMRKILTPPVP
ncbi:MAG: GNAT family N-acetyltransferase [Hyphomicrobiales bacterium]|nr:GNAT family N-acetyltransferase [Hyphomicrobiales bacterium]